MSPKKTILIVDDEPMLQSVCELVLRTHGFPSIITSNGLEALEVYRERHEEICLVLADIAMPVMDGVEMTRKLFEFHSHANVILMSGAHLSNLVPDDVRRLCSVIEKPFTPRHLLQAVRKCLKYDEEHHRSGASSS